jgi:hypothetical protein
MCGGVLDCHCDTTRSRRSDFGKIRVKCQCEGRLLVGSSVGLSSRSKFDICRSTNRKNRVLRTPATTDSCDIGADDPEGRLFGTHFAERSGVVPPTLELGRGPSRLG